ncbi:tetratricopeptide repeat protein 14-like isoform X5 [Halichondria panicea]
MAQESHKHTDSTMQSGYEIPTAHEDIVSKQHHGAGGVESKKPADEFQARIKKFRIKHAVSFKQDAVAMAASVPTHNYQKEEQYSYGEPEALELHMRVGPNIRVRRVFELIKPGDFMEGHVTSKEFGQLAVRITSFVGSYKFRELADINVQGRVIYDNLSDEVKERDKILEEMQVKDVVQGVVVGCHDNIVSLSFRESHAQELTQSQQLSAALGYRSGKAPSKAKQWTGHSDDFLRHLEDDPGFGNPSCTDTLKIVLGIGPGTSGTEPLVPGMKPTLFSNIQMAEYAPSDYHGELRKAQRAKWSLDSVAAGVAAFKAGEGKKALKMLDHALSIDPQNVEGLVARGALYANDGQFKEAIHDFEKALTLNHTHRNARTYLVETQVVYGRELEKSGRIEEAMRCYKEALADDPHQSMARQRLQLLTAITEKQVCKLQPMDNVATHCGHSVHVATTHCGHSVHVATTHCGHSVHVATTHCGHSVHVATTHCGHSVHVATTHCGHSVHVATTHCGHSVHVATTHCGHSVHVATHCGHSVHVATTHCGHSVLLCMCVHVRVYFFSFFSPPLMALNSCQYQHTPNLDMLDQNLPKMLYQNC